jgi:hypothetical protein
MGNKKKMADYAKGWVHPDNRKNTPDSKGPGPNDWKKGLGGKPKKR